MRILLDECLPRQLAEELAQHEVVTVQKAGWAGTKNGQLLRKISGRFAVFLTIDKRIEREQKIPAGGLVDQAFLLLWTGLRPCFGGAAPCQETKISSALIMPPSSNAPTLSCLGEASIGMKTMELTPSPRSRSVPSPRELLTQDIS